MQDPKGPRCQIHNRVQVPDMVQPAPPKQPPPDQATSSLVAPRRTHIMRDVGTTTNTRMMACRLLSLSGRAGLAQ